MIDPVNIVIPVYNQVDFLRITLDSLLQNTSISYHLWLVNNGSNDITVKYINEQTCRFKNITILSSSENLGYARGNNLALRQIKEGHVLLLNSDVYLPRDWDTQLFLAFNQNTSVGIIGPITNNACPKSGQKFLHIKFYDRLKGADIEKLAKQITQFNMQKPIVRLVRRPINGFCMLVRDTTFSDTGLLCEEFGIGNGEDEEYCLRASKFGYKTAIANRCFVYHYGSKTINTIFSKEDYANSLKNAAKILSKAYPEVDLLSQKWFS